jgi:hypothetical protein
MKKPAGMWSAAQQNTVQKKINKAAAKLAKEMGGAYAVVTVFWEAPGDNLHMQTGGQSPWPLSVLFERLTLRFRSVEADNAASPDDTVN